MEKSIARRANPVTFLPVQIVTTKGAEMLLLINIFFFASQECNSFQEAISLRSYEPLWSITCHSLSKFFFQISCLTSDLTKYSFLFLVFTQTQIYHRFSKKNYVETQMIETFLHHLQTNEKP